MPGLLKQGVKSQMISTQDIGWFAVNAFEHPEKWRGKRFEIAGDKLDAWECVRAAVRRGAATVGAAGRAPPKTARLNPRRLKAAPPRLTDS